MSDINTLIGVIISHSTRLFFARCVSSSSYRVSPAEFPVDSDQPVETVNLVELCSLMLVISMLLRQDFMVIGVAQFISREN